MSKFRKKPVVIEAMQWDGSVSSADAIEEWSGGKTAAHGIADGWADQAGVRSLILRLYIDTLEGQMRADPGDWIIKGVAGEFYPCKAPIFAATYEAVE